MIASGQKSNQKVEYLVSIENILKPCIWEEGINTIQFSTFMSPMKQILYNKVSGLYFMLGGEKLYYSSDKINWFSVLVTTPTDGCITNNSTVYLLAQNNIFKCINNNLTAPDFSKINSTDSYYSLATDGDIVIAGGLREIYYLEDDTFQKSLSGLTESNNSFRVWSKGGKFFATDGNSDKSQPLYVSSNGKNWIQAQNGNKICNYYTKVEYFNNFWYANFDSYLYKSSDGENWEKTSVGNVIDFLGGENNFFILDSGGNILNLNNDLIATLPNVSIVHSGHYGIQIFNNNNFWSIWASNSAIANVNMIYSNDNGKNWQTISLPGCGSLIKINEQYWTFIYNTKKIFFTTNLKNWKESQFAVKLSSITVGQSSAIGLYNNEIYYTSDGITWKKASQPAFVNSNEKNYMSLSYVQSTFFICTNYNSTYYWYYSEKGDTWSTVTSSTHPGIINIDKDKIAPVKLEEYTNTVFAFDEKFTKYSTQNVDLTLLCEFNSQDIQNINSKAYTVIDNGFFVVGLAKKGIYLTSIIDRYSINDQNNFSYDTNNLYTQFFCVNHRLYAVDNNLNLIYFSDDFNYWYSSSTTLYSSIDYMFYGDGLYIIIDEQANFYISYDGKNFSLDNDSFYNIDTSSSENILDLFYVFYTGSFWIGITFGGLYYSKDTNSWTKFHKGPLIRNRNSIGNFTPRDKSFTLFQDGEKLYYYTIPVQIS